MKHFIKAIRRGLDIILISLAMIAFILTMFFCVGIFAGGISTSICLVIAGVGVMYIDDKKGGD